MTIPWTEIEVELIVADYFEMLRAELSGENYNKAQHRRRLLPLLNKRSEGSIEFKHQNISAALINLSLPFIKGYLPRFNYQNILAEKIIEYLKMHPEIEKLFINFTENKEIKVLNTPQFDKLITEPPQLNIATEPEPFYNRNPIKINYLEREQNNSQLGELGESLVVDYEKWQLNILGKDSLAEQVRWISKEEGDGAGFDILSKHTNGKDKYIEVKTTRLNKETPFYFTHNELQFSISNSNNFFLYRLFNFDSKTGMFIKNGSLNTVCNYSPINYRGFF